MSTHLNRIAAAVFGGYAFTWGFTALGIAGLVALGIDFHEAETGVLMVAFLVFLIAFLWTFTITSVLRVWMVLAGGAAAMLGTAWMLQRMLLG